MKRKQIWNHYFCKQNETENKTKNNQAQNKHGLVSDILLLLRVE